jgi:guanylate cyclase
MVSSVEAKVDYDPLNFSPPTILNERNELKYLAVNSKEPDDGGTKEENNDADQFDLTQSLDSQERRRNAMVKARKPSTSTNSAFRRQSQPPEETDHDEIDHFDRSESAESFEAYKMKHKSSESFNTHRNAHQPRNDIKANASFSSERSSSLRRRRGFKDPLRQNIAQRPALESRESFELKQAALYSLQLDGTLQQISNIEHLKFDEEWATKQNLWKRLAIRASAPDTSQKELIQRSTFLIISAMTVGAGVLWGFMYVVLGEWLAAIMPFIYSTMMGTILTSCICYSKNKYDIVVESQLSLILLLPMAVHLALGGMEASGGVMLWSFLCPMGAAFFRSANESLRWFYIYMTFTVTLLCLDYRKSPEGEADIVRAMYFAMNILGVKGVIFGVVFFFARELETEYNKSEEVLSNILPSAIVTRIKRGEFPIVDHVAGVSILFADLVGFTKASTELHPNFLIGLFLRDVFHSFDELVYKHNLEKIKTIGDAYMVVGGLNHGKGTTVHEEKDHHTQRMMILALDMLNELQKINSKYNLKFELRIGVHRGPVVAGVLGLKRFTYDVWGDSVNVSLFMVEHL